MHTISKTFVGAGVAFVALFSLALTFSTAKAADLDVGGGGWYAESYTDSYPAPYDYYPSYGSTGWYAESYTDSYPASYDYGYSSYGGYSSPSFSYPSFSSPGFASALPQMPSFAQQQMSTVANTCTGNSCNTDNRYYDNSIFNAPTTVTVANTGDDRRPDYHDYYQPYRPAYQPPATYSSAPYISLSQTPYTGLELTPAQEALYWSFLILWCLAIAYLIVYKRVLQRTVNFLNGFLFGSTPLTTGGSTPLTTGGSTPLTTGGSTPLTTGGSAAVAAAHAAPAPKAPAPKAEPVEEGVDPFILSQIKR